MEEARRYRLIVEDTVRPVDIKEARVALTRALMRAAQDIAVPMDGVPQELRDAWRAAIDRKDNYEQGAVETLHAFANEIVAERQLVGLLRDAATRTMLLVIKHEGEQTGAALTQGDRPSAHILAALIGHNYVIASGSHPDTHVRISPKGEQALALADRILGPVSS